MKITINGNEAVLEKGLTIAEVLKTQKVEMQEYVTVQVNDEIISREDFEKVTLKENDAVEFLYFMGGGTI